MNEFFTLSFEVPLTGTEIDAAAMAVSCLLAQSPYTKPIPAEQIAAEIDDGEGMAALDSSGMPAGYVALRPFDLLTNFVLATADAEPLMEARVAHFGLGSLVVHPDARGRGLGTILLNTALLAARSQLYTTEVTANFAIVSAVAAPTSQKLFADSGFWQTDNPAIASAHGYSPRDPLPATKQLTHKIVA